MSVAARLDAVKQRIADAARHSGRPAESVKLIAVSKTKPDALVQEAAAAGQAAFGENRMQDLAARFAALPDPGLEWHMIGTLQTNKLKHIIHRVDWIHSAGKRDHLDEINRLAARHNRSVRVLIQVNISEEDQKSGCEPSALTSILENAGALSNIHLCGLMGMAALSDDERVVRPQFALLRRLFEASRPSAPDTGVFTELSMGMSHDFAWAIAEGATMVRIGSAIFGDR